MQTVSDAADISRQCAVIGGGAAGFFAAITAAEANPAATVTIYERGNNCLSKVKVSGGGRCNVTHSCFDPSILASHYPRGSRELHGSFHRWQPQDTVNWFAERGVILKTEEDGRMFPDTDDSQTIIDCFMESARKAGIQLRMGVGLTSLKAEADGSFTLGLSDDTAPRADAVCIASGSLKPSPITRAIEALGHTIEPLAPSLFSFDLSDARTQGLAGLSVQNVSVKALPDSPPQVGPILITHRGVSGPAILRLSSWEARKLQASDYRFEISINWLGDVSKKQVLDRFDELRRTKGRTAVKTKLFEEIPRRLWERIVSAADIADKTQWSQLSSKHRDALAAELVAARFKVQGKTTNKEEFVTCGGVSLKEIDFRRMESRKVPGLHFAGECLDIDGITGGFNFQSAWTGGHIAGLALADDNRRR